MLLFLPSLGLPEILFILTLALLIFGPKKIPEIARSLGKGLRDFRQSTSGFMDSINQDIQNPPPAPRQIASNQAPQTTAANSTPPAEASSATPTTATTAQAPTSGTSKPSGVEAADEVVINLEDGDAKS